jgi:hypothetical protein
MQCNYFGFFGPGRRRQYNYFGFFGPDRRMQCNYFDFFGPGAGASTAILALAARPQEPVQLFWALRPGRKSQYNYFGLCGPAAGAGATILGFAAWPQEPVQLYWALRPGRKNEFYRVYQAVYKSGTPSLRRRSLKQSSYTHVDCFTAFAKAGDTVRHKPSRSFSSL